MNASRHPHRTLQTVALTGFAGVLTFAAAGCKHNQTVSAQTTNGDPAAANMAQPYTGTPGQAQVAGQTQSYTPQSSGETYETQAPAPIIRQSAPGTSSAQYYPVPQARQNPAQYTDPQQGYADQGQYNQAAPQSYGDQQAYSGQQGYDSQQAYNQGYTDAEEAGEQALAETDQAPPPLPEYDQPPAPADDYIWTPGYWNYASSGYYWVPGVWCAPPFVGALWTPPWWGYEHSHYLFHRGYWGPHIGYYGGVNYGFGYIGFGYFGGYWRDRSFVYNRAVTNINTNIVHNYYIHNVVYDNHTYGPHPDNRVSYNGGPHGLSVQPRPQEIAAFHEAHYAPVAAQRDNRIAASQNRSQFFRENGGRPAEAFANRPLGTVNNIPSTPHEQAFNHPGAPNRPDFTGRPGEAARPNGQPAQPGNRGGGFNGGNQPGQPNFNARPGASQPTNAIRSGEVARPNEQPAQPGFDRRSGTPNQPAFGNHPGESVRPNTQPAQPVNRPNEFNRGGAQPNALPGNRTGSAADQPARNQPAPAQPAPAQPAVNAHRPYEFNRGGQPSQPRPNVDAQRPAAVQPRPDFNAQRNLQPQQEARPHFEQPRANVPQPEARPNFGQSRPAPQPEARPQPAAPRQPAPAQAPHAGGGEPHPHNH